jgi:tRNA threonylcarbamoyladenosine biosynthesis protein TsaB
MIVALRTDGMTTQLWLVLPGAAAPDQPTVEWDSGRGLSDDLLGRIQTMVEQGGYQLADLTGLVVFSGPGSFTSLRIGHTVANALADGLGISVVGARGEHWLAEALRVLPRAKAGHPVLPYYGREANITRPGA